MRTSNTCYAAMGRLAGFRNRGHLTDYEEDWAEDDIVEDLPEADVVLNAAIKGV